MHASSSWVLVKARACAAGGGGAIRGAQRRGNDSAEAAVICSARPGESRASAVKTARRVEEGRHHSSGDLSSEAYRVVNHSKGVPGGSLRVACLRDTLSRSGGSNRPGGATGFAGDAATGITDSAGAGRKPRVGQGFDRARPCRTGAMAGVGRQRSRSFDGGIVKSGASYGSTQLKGIKQDWPAYKSLACSEIADVPECTG